MLWNHGVLILFSGRVRPRPPPYDPLPCLIPNIKISLPRWALLSSSRQDATHQPARSPRGTMNGDAASRLLQIRTSTAPAKAEAGSGDSGGGGAPPAPPLPQRSNPDLREPALGNFSVLPDCPLQPCEGPRSYSSKSLSMCF